jgi:membrane protein implicated in regulation of membrane protease activity
VPAEVVWFVVAGALAVGELLTGGLYLLMLAGGALVAALVALLGGDVAWQVVGFFVASGGLTLGLRPIARRHLMTTPLTHTGSAALVGAEGVVLEPVNRDDGRVKIRGEVWSARAYPEDALLAAGSRVRVLRIDGATAVVHQDDISGPQAPRGELA